MLPTALVDPQLHSLASMYSLTEQVGVSDRTLQKEYSSSELNNLSNTTSSNLNHQAHGRISCPLCGRTFVQMSTLRRHLKIHIGGPSADCAVCGKGFSRNDALMRHIRKFHNEDT